MNKHSVSLFILCSLILCGCTGEMGESSAIGLSSESASSVEETGMFDPSSLHYQIDIAASTGRSELIEKQVQEYLTQNGYTNVTLKFSAPRDEETDVSLIDWTSGPDIYYFEGNQLLSLNQVGALSPLPEEIQKKFEEKSGCSAKAGMLGNKMYAYPYSIENGYFLYYDRSIVSHPDDLKQLLAECHSKNRRLVYSLSSGFYSIGLLSSFGAGYTINLNTENTAIESVEATFDTEKGLTAVKQFQSLLYHEDVDILGTDDMTAPTAANDVGATISGIWNYDSFKEVLGDNLGVAQLPSVTVDDEKYSLHSLTGYQCYGVNPLGNKDETKLNLLHKIAEYLSSDQAQLENLQELNLIPASQSLMENEEMKKDEKAYTVLSQSLSSLPQSIMPTHIWEAVGNLYSYLTENETLSEEELKQEMKTFNILVEKVD